MGDLKIKCPLCCDKTFDSKQGLLEHLASISGNLYCPICNSQCSSLVALTAHLSLYDCQNTDTTHSNIVMFDQQSMQVVNIEHSDAKSITDGLNSTADNTNFITDQTYNPEDGKMYVDLLGKQVSKPLESQELKLIKEDGDSYMIITQEENLGEDSAVVTKLNNDGTISLTSVKDMKLDTDTLIAPEPDSGSSEEIYSCNACEVTFTSVIEHIQNYHNDQEVVLEDMPSAVESECTDSPINQEPFEEEDSSASDKQAPRRVITETGDIVEEPIYLKSECINPRQKLIGKAGLYHKVITKEVQSKKGLTTRMYSCVLCDMTVSSLSDFNSHPCQILQYPCPQCPGAFESSKSLYAHMKIHRQKTAPDVPEPPTSYPCEVCNTIFTTNKSLKLHKRMHDPIKVRPIEPPENSNGLITNEIYHCEICDKMIPYDYRDVHTASHAKGDNCSICNKKFSSKEYLEMHMNVHNLDKVPINNQDKSLPYECLYCNRRFGRPHEKVKHERIHTGEKPHSCEICGKSFRVSYCLTLHMRTHTGARPYECPHCGKRFKAHSVYNHHLLTHSDVRAYKCPYCPKAFKTSVQLAGHKNSHTKPFSCQQCNRPFASLYAVRVHTETHGRQNNLKFSCTLCGASYARAFALKDHIKQVHQQDMETAQNVVVNTSNEDWMVREDAADTEDMSLNKELQEDITDLEMDTSELIIP